MHIFKLTREGREIGYFRTWAVAEESLRITFSAYTNLRITSTVSSLVVDTGITELEYFLTPVEVYTEPEHL